MSFEHNANKPTPKADDRREARREDAREEPRGRRVEREEAAREERQLTSVNRNFNLGGGDAGRANTFLRTMKEEVTSDQEVLRQFLEPDSILLSSNLNTSMGYLVYVDDIGGDVMWHLLVFESEQKSVQVLPYGNRRDRRREEEIDVYIATVDSFDEGIINDFEDFVRRNVASNGDYVFANATVIPSEVKLTDRDVVKAIAFNAEDSCVTLSGHAQPFTEAHLQSEKSQVRGTIRFQKKVKDDAVDLLGLPIRSDFQVVVEDQFRDKVENVLRAGYGSRQLIALDGYVNARWVGPDDTRRRRRDEEEIDTYVAEVVVSQVNPYNLGSSRQLEGNFERMFLGMAMLPYFHDRELWKQQFLKSFHGGDDQRISGLAYGIDWPGDFPRDLEVIDGDADRTEKWLDRVFRRDENDNFLTEFALMVREGGMGYTTSKLLLDVAVGDMSAFEQVMRSMDALTGGVFSEVSNASKCSDIIVGSVRVPQGYYQDRDGDHAIEEIDTLTVLNRVKNNFPEMLDDWFDVFSVDDRVLSYDEAMTKMVKLLQHVTGNSFVLKGFNTKLYINPDFLADVYEAVSRSDLRIEEDIAGDMFTRGRRRRHGGGVYGMSERVTQRNRRSFSGRGRNTYRTNYR